MTTAVPVQPIDQDTDTEVTEREITANDRCDHSDCTAQAYYRCHFMEGELLFCRHHFMPLSEVLHEQALMVEDFTYLLD